MTSSAFLPNGLPATASTGAIETGRFATSRRKRGLVRRGWASSVCAGDYDNDGWLDLFITYYGTNVLYRNRGGERFEDVTAAAGLAAPGTRWGSGCSFLDYDRDGRLDLFVASYLVFDLETAREPGQGATACGRESRSTAGPRACPRTRTTCSTTRATAASATCRPHRASRQ